MLSCWTQRMQRRQRFCSNLHVSISVYVCPCVSVHVCTEPAWTQQIAWYELYYQKFYKCHLLSCQHVPIYTSYVHYPFHLRTLRPPDPNGHRARWWSSVLQDAWASGTQSNDFRMNEWCNFSNEKRGWSMYDQIDSNCIYWLHTPSTYEYVRNPYAFMMLENAKLHYSMCFFLD